MDKFELDVLMVFTGGGDFYDPNFRYVLGAGYIIAYLRKHGFRAQQYISNDLRNINACIKEILDYHPKVVGFTVYNSNVMQSILIAKALKISNPHVITIFGGPTATVQSEDILKDYNSIDICVRGEGEEILLHLLEHLSVNNFDLEKIPIENIKGLSYRKGKQILFNPDSDILYSHRIEKDYLDKYPSPYLTNVIPVSYALPLGIITARGCNQNCIYCNCATLNKRNIYFHSVNRVIEELRYLSDYIKEFKNPIAINDDAFTIIPHRARDICNKIIKSEIKIPLGCITRADKIDEDLLDLMKLAGFVSIGFSLESAVPKILRSIGKVCPPSLKDYKNLHKERDFIRKVETMSSYAKKIGMKFVFASMMTGLPGETLQDAHQTLRLIEKMNLNFYAHNYLHLYKGTPIYENHKKYGYHISHIGRKNKFFTTNSYPFDVYKLKMGSTAADMQNFEVIDYNTIQTISLIPKKCIENNFFRSVIIDTDILIPKMVRWMQENLAINGCIYHIYSDKQEYENTHLNNESLLFDELSPTDFYEHYYWEHDNDIRILKSGRMLKYGEEAGKIISFKNMDTAISEYIENKQGLENLIAQEDSIKDTLSFLELFDTLSNESDPFEYLFGKSMNPQFLNLCRWTTNKANCLCLETAILTDTGIKICWNSEPITAFNKNFSEFKEELEIKKRKFEEKMNCRACMKSNDCLKCIFPYPMNSEQYCDLSSKRNKKPANLLYSFNAIKDFLYKPISLYDF